MKDACEGRRASELIKIALIAFAVLVVSGCNNYYNTHHIYIEDGLIFKQGESKPFTGRILDTLENKIVEYDVVQGLKNGEFCVANFDGIFTVSGAIKNNQNVGTWSYYYEGGQLESKGSFKNDLPHGKWQWFYIDGTLKSEGYYINGIEEGEWKSFSERGVLRSITRFVRGEITNKVKLNKIQRI